MQIVLTSNDNIHIQIDLCDEWFKCCNKNNFFVLDSTGHVSFLFLTPVNASFSHSSAVAGGASSSSVPILLGRPPGLCLGSLISLSSTLTLLITEALN